MERVRAYVNPSRRTVDVYISPEDGWFKILTSEDGWVARQIGPNGAAPVAFSIPEEYAADVAVALQQCGLPSGRTFDQGKLQATERHLADMRKLLFDEVLLSLYRDWKNDRIKDIQK